MEDDYETLSGPEPHKLSTKMLIGLIAGGAVLVVLVVVVVLTLVLAGPSKRDFQQANGIMLDIRQEYDRLDRAAQDYLQQVSYGEAADATGLELGFRGYRGATERLAESKVLEDKVVKSAYDAFEAKNRQTLGHFEALLASRDDLYEVGKRCSLEVTSASAETDRKKILAIYEQTYIPCMDSLMNLARSNNSSLAAYANRLISTYREQRDLYKDLQKAIDEKEVEQEAVVRSQIASAESKFMAHGTAVASLKEGARQSDPRAEMEKLLKVIFDKYRKR